MAAEGYNSKFEGLEVDARLDKVIPATAATASEAGKGGLIPAPPAGSQDGSKALLSNMTWGEHVTKQYIDDAVSAAGWRKQIVTALPEAANAEDNVMYLVKDDLASTDTKNVYNEYILVTDSAGTKSLESLGMVSTGVDMTYLDITPLISGEETKEVYDSIALAYENKVIVGFKDGATSIFPIYIGRVSSDNGYKFVVDVETVIVQDDLTITVYEDSYEIRPDYSIHLKRFYSTITRKAIWYADFMSKSPNVVTTLTSLPLTAHNIIANVTAATELSMGAVSSGEAGLEWTVRVNNTTDTDITQPIPTTGTYQSMSGDSVTIPANSFIELSIWYINDKLVIRVGQIA